MRVEAHAYRSRTIAVLVCVVTPLLLSSCGFYEGYYKAIRDANEAAAIKTLTNIAEQQMLYFNAHERKEFGTFDEMLKDHLLDIRYAGAAPVLSGYIFTMRITPKSPTQPPAYTINADPQQADGVGATGKKHYFLDSNTNTIHVNSSRPATVNDPQIQQR